MVFGKWNGESFAIKIMTFGYVSRELRQTGVVS